MYVGRVATDGVGRNARDVEAAARRAGRGRGVEDAGRGVPAQGGVGAVERGHVRTHI